MRCLIVSVADWHGPARLPKALKRAGWEVGMLCRRQDAAAKTRFADRFFFANPRSEGEAMTDVLNAIEVWEPDLIVPAQEPVIHVLYDLWRLHAAGRLPQASEKAIQAIRRSIPDPDKLHFGDGKMDLLNALQERGVKIPPMRELHHLGDADAFVQEHGYPVIVKPDTGAAGSGIAICENEGELLEALRERLKPGYRGRWCIQKFISGKPGNHNMVAWEGKAVASVSMRRIVVHPAPTGPSTVIETIENADMDFAAQQFAELLGYNGFASCQFMIEEGTGHAYFIEANFRIGAFKHLGYLFGRDIVLGLKQAMEGKPVELEPLKVGLTITLYPQEWIRAQESEYMQGTVDWVTDDPDLAEHYAAQVKAKWGMVPSAR